MPNYNHILIIVDIEGSSGCFDYRDSCFMAKGWAEACVAMSRDVDAVCRALYEAGVGLVSVKDFHRTGYNLIPELIDPRARIVHGYRQGPVMGLGDPLGAEAVMFIGLHAPSGSDGFLAHTLTSRIARIEINGCLTSEVELFSASLAPFQVRPIFFSGCPIACDYARKAIDGLVCYPIDKSPGRDGFHADSWRAGLAEAAVAALDNTDSVPFEPAGPFQAWVRMRDGCETAAKIGDRWGFQVLDDEIIIECQDIHQLYLELARVAYLNLWTNTFLETSLWAYNRLGKLGLSWVRWRKKTRKRISGEK